MKVYAAKNKDLNTRLNSSSGGIFTLLAETILNEGGSVIGASFDGLDVKHIKVNDINGLSKLRGSKYVRSKVDYKLIDKDLILFSGTPCQMPLSQPNLLLVDLVCHGTPKVKKYIDYCIKNGIKSINFRDKTQGWANFQVRIETDEGITLRDFKVEPFMQDFLNNRNLCDSCYNCKFKNLTSNSDITLGDFWGIQNEYPEFSDNIGISLVIIKTDKGQEYFNKIKDRIDYIEADLDKAIKYNPSIVSSAIRR